MQLATLMDGLIATGTSKEMIVVVPNGRNAYFGSFYTNSPVTGGWEDFVARELVRWVDGNFRTVAAAESRGIAGHSMGGYGAIMLGMKHPDVFGAFYALSPCCVGLEGDLGPENQAWVAAAQVRTRNLVGLRCARRVLAHSNHDACVFHRVGEPRYRAHVRGLTGREPREQDPRASRNPRLPLLFRGSASSLSLVRVTLEPWRPGLPLG